MSIQTWIYSVDGGPDRTAQSESTDPEEMRGTIADLLGVPIEYVTARRTT